MPRNTVPDRLLKELKSNPRFLLALLGTNHWDNSNDLSGTGISVALMCLICRPERMPGVAISHCKKQMTGLLLSMPM